MREILFRGKYSDGNWIYGNYIHSPGNDLKHNICPNDSPYDWYEVDPETIGQFTGLLDKNGRKVFEGDILAYHLEDFEDETIDGVVKYGQSNCSCCDGVYGWYIEGGDIRVLDENKCYDDDERLYVVGNIHDNPELVEKKEKE